MEFSWQEYWSGLPFPFPGDLLNPMGLLHFRQILYCLNHQGRLTLSFKPFWNMKGGTWMPRVVLWGPELGLFPCSLHLALQGARAAGGSSLYQPCLFRWGPSPSLVHTAHHRYLPNFSLLWSEGFLVPSLVVYPGKSLWSLGPDRGPPSQLPFLQRAWISPRFSSGASEQAVHSINGHFRNWMW